MGELQERIDRLEKVVIENSEKKKEKKFGLPWSGKVGNGKAKKGYLAVLKINENGFATFEKHQIEEQTVVVDGVPRIATPDYVLKIKKGFKTYPLLILPSCSMKPYNPNEVLEQSFSDGTNPKGIKLILNRMKLSAVEKLKKSIPPIVLWIIGLIVVVGGGYLLFTGQI
jgi:hypothetical protein